MLGSASLEALARARRRRPPILALLLAAAAAVQISACARTPLPEPHSHAAHLYARRCGGCHQPYNPHTMTAAMWKAQVDRMQSKIAEAGLQPLSAGQRKVILDYLTRNAGTE
jgi:Dihaem cytochrome c